MNNVDKEWDNCEPTLRYLFLKQKEACWDSEHGEEVTLIIRMETDELGATTYTTISTTGLRSEDVPIESIKQAKKNYEDAGGKYEENK